MRARQVQFVFILCLASLSPAFVEAQSATITFTLDFPNSDPEHYSISVDFDGRAHYESTFRISSESEDRDSYKADFAFSDAGRARVFELAAQAKYFADPVDSGNAKLAFTGKKTLAYADGHRSATATYNFSRLSAIETLTNLFQRTAATQEFGRRLDHYHHYQKLALDDELKRMEDEAQRNELAELQSVTPILQRIYDDPGVMNVVRARTQRILQMAKKPPTNP